MNVLVERKIIPELLFRLGHFPVVAITGPRQAGKTTLAKSLLSQLEKPAIYLDLELPSDLNRLQNAELFLGENMEKTVVIDEVQRKPELFTILRSLVDQKREPGRYLILGSASPELLRQSSETLAGRISYLELTPFHYRELSLETPLQHWLRGGFPPAFLAPSERVAFQWLNDFTTTFIERHLPQFGLTAPAQMLRNLLLMLTGIHGNLLNYSNLAKSLGVTMPTVKRYLQYFDHAYFTRNLLPWYSNVGKRLVKTPKIYFRDSGVLHGLLGIRDMNSLLGSQIAGSSWEGYVIQQVLSNLPPSVSPYFYRTKDGSEVDLVLAKGNQPVLTIEIMFSDNPTLSRGNHLAIDNVNAPFNLIVVPSGGDYPVRERVRVCDLGQLWKYLDEI